VANNKKRVQPVLLKIGLSFLTILLVGAIVFTTYYFTINKADSGYINTLYEFKVDVDKCNDTVAKATNSIDNLNINKTSELKDIRSIISDASFNLNNILQDVQKVTAPSKYKTQFESLVNGISTNKKIFTQTILILRNTHSNNISKGINDLNTYVSNTSKYYEIAKLKKAYIKLPDGILSMSEKISKYAFKSFDDYENKTHELEDYLAYFKLMDNVVSNFNNTKINLGVNYNQIKSEEISIDDVYVKIEGKLSELAQIQSNYEAISIPSNVKIKDRHIQFNDIIKRYTYYCQDFKIAINRYEETSTDADADADAEAEAAFAFDDLEIKYKTLSKTFTDYISSYNADKSKFSNINNL
jgi:hypothetical protein